MVTPLATGRDVLGGDPQDARTDIAGDQRRIVETDVPALRVTAPAGSGKTRTMIEWALDRAAALDPKGNQSVLAVSFTNRAAADLQTRMAQALTTAGLPVDLVRVSTFHSFAAHLIGEFGHHVGLPTSTRLIGDADATALVEAVLADHVFDELDASWLPTVTGNVLQLAAALADHRLRPEDAIRWHEERLEAYAGHEDEAKSYPQQYKRNACETARQITADRLDLLRTIEPFRELKRQRGVLDYGAQMLLATRLAELSEIRAELQDRHPDIVVDEYQDTNVVQRELLQALWAPDRTQLVVVGDDVQAIYRFRGATLDNFRSFGEHFPGAREERLVNVYRHGPEIIEVAEAIAHTDRETEPQPEHSETQLKEFPDQQEEATWIADHVAALTEDADPREVGVLAPQRRFLVPVARELEERGVPVEAPGLHGLFDSPTFHTVHALLRVAHDPGDAVAAVRLLRGPRYRLGPHDLVPFVEAADALARRERREADLEWMDDAGVRLLDGLLEPERATSAEAKERVERFLDDVRRWVAMARRLPLAEFVEEASGDLGLVDALHTAPTAEAVRARSELEATIDAARDYEAVERGAGLAGFLDHLERMLDEDEPIEVADPDPAARAVRLLTIHSAKGLGFRHVVVCGVVDGALPNVRLSDCEITGSGRGAIPHALRRDGHHASPTLWDPDDLERHKEMLRDEARDEARRLFYVACTRAEESLAVTRSVWQWDVQGMVPKKTAGSSPFFEELREADLPIDWVGDDVPDANPLEPFDLWEGDERPQTTELERATASGSVPDAPGTDEIRTLARRLKALEDEQRPAAPAPPTEHTVTDLVLALRCPTAYARRKVLGLPQPVNDAARRGSLVHRWIEERGWALAEGRDPDAIPRPWHEEEARTQETRPEQVVVDEDEGAEAPSDDPPGPVVSDADADACADGWLRSPYASLAPSATELPAVLTVGGAYVRGTVDAVYDHPDGAWEVVDVKTGGVPSDEEAWLQLEAYALALASAERPLERARLTFVGVGAEPGTDSRPASSADAIQDRLATALGRMTEVGSCPGCDWCS